MDNFVYNEGKVFKIGQHTIGIDIPYAIVISLKNRPDKHKYCIDYYPFPFKFFFAELHENPKRGNVESHTSAIQFAKNQDWENVIICEDDCVFIKDLSSIPEYPTNTDMIYYGGLLVTIKNWLTNWIQGGIYCNHFYLVKKHCYETILNNFENQTQGIDTYIVGLEHDNKIVSYIPTEQYVLQKEGYSDIDRKDKWHLYQWPKPGERFYIP